ncbi:CoA transferase [Rhizobium johnstonii]|uniref:CaiB/BaiF CoA-transferase family protein n=1 Tax=Rhizobium johnstonii TaxID=3019933 RepID=UPI003F9D8D84
MLQTSASGSLRRVSEMLQGLTVFDASNEVAGRFCARLMADNGAGVTLATAAEVSSASAPIWRHLNAGKRLESWDVSDQQIFGERVRGSDIVICNSSWQVQACRSANERIIAVLITPFGQHGPYSGWRGTEVIYQALSGSMPNNGKAAMPPLYGCGDRASYAAGVMAYCGAMAAVVERGVSQKGQNVDVAIAEVAAAMTTGAVAFGYSGKAPAARTTAQSMICCSGEWVLLWCYPFQWEDFCIALDAIDLYDDPRFAEQGERAVNWQMLLEILQDRLGDRTADEIVAKLRGRKLITAKSERPSQMGDNPHLNARGYWQEHYGRRVLGPLFRAYRSEEDTENSPFDNRLGSEIASPLSRLRVFDLTTAWAGPMAGRYLAFLGADVIHVEHASKPDLWRHHRQVYNDALYVEGGNPERRYNRNALFNSQNINKRSLCLDLKSPEGARIAKQIAEHCDVILTNFTPGTLDRLGIGYKALSQLNPNVIVCEMPAFGLSGPQRDALAVGATMEMAAAMSAMVGYREGTPTTTGPHLPDPIGGLNATAAILTALVHRQMHGGGQLVEVAQVEAAMQYVGAELLEAIETGVDRVPDGNRLAHTAPHDVFPASGLDQWVAIAVLDDVAWYGLCQVINPGLMQDSRFAQLESRLAHQDALCELISAWTCTRNKRDAAATLQAAGVAAAPVLEASEMFDDPFLADRGAFAVLPHPEVGPRPYHTVPVRLSRTPGVDRVAGPCLGEHTDVVLAEFGVDAAQRQYLAARGVTNALPT